MRSTELNLDDWEKPDGIRVTAVTSERELDAWLDVADGCGWIETPAERTTWKKLHLGLGTAPSAPNPLYVAFRSDNPVGMASAFLAGDIVQLTAVGVLDHERRRGIGRSLALTRLRAARDRGCKVAVLAASPDGASLYKTLGFETHAQPDDRWFYLPTLAS